MLFTRGVIGRIGIGIAAAPEFFDKLIALFVGGEAEEGVAFFLGDDVDRFLGEPSVVGSAFLGQFAGLLIAIFRALRFGRGALVLRRLLILRDGRI